MTVFAPTRMQDWSRCPVYSQLKRQIEPIDTVWEPNKLMGIALGEGLSHYWNDWRRYKLGGPGVEGAPDPDKALEKSLETLRGGFEEQEKWTLAGLEKMLTRCLEAALKEDVLSAGTIISVDQTLGVGRPDLIQVGRDKSLVVTDVKFTLRLEQQYQVKRLMEYETDDQFRHYSWEAREHFGSPVTWNRVLLVIGSPKPRAVLHPWRVNDQAINFWLTGAEQNWKDMQEEKDGVRPVVPQFRSCVTKYGRCTFYGWCHEPDSMRQFYKELPPRDHGSHE